MMVAFLNPQSIVNVRIYVEGPSSRMHFSYFADAAPKSGPWWQRRFEHKPTDSQTHSPLPSCEETNLHRIMFGKACGSETGKG